jgi:cell wall-associated NlpC family hydrolase
MVLAALGALVAGLLSAAPAAAEQDQPPTTVAGLLSRYKDLSNQAERANEELLQFQEELDAKRTAARDLTQRADAARKAAGDARSRADKTQQDTARYTTLLSTRGDLNALSAFLTSNSQDDVVTKMQAASMATHLSGSAAQQGELAIAEADKAARDAVQAQNEARKTETAVQAGANQVQRRRDELNRQITEVKATLDRLPPEQLSMLQDTGGDVGRNVQIPAGNAGNAVRFALNQIGRPYLWGAIGPDSYDCSGLMLIAYRTAGVNLPRVSIQQSAVGQQIDRADIRAGDMIFYYTPVHHVAMAIDNTRAVHAPAAGQNVKISRIDAIGPITVIRRVVR